MSDFKLEINKDKLESTMTRTFDAPREKVWQAHTDPKLMEQWWGPRMYTNTIEIYEPKVGGKWRIAQEAKGERHVFFGEFKEIEEPEKITWTFNYEPYPNSEIVETLHLEELPDGKTKLTTISHYPSLEALVGMAESGMEQGARESWDRLQELLDRIKE